MQKFPLRANPNFFKESRFVRTQSLCLYTLPNSSETCRYAVVVPKKIVPLSTRRNALKRQIFAFLQHMVSNTPTNDIVFRVGNAQLLDERSKIAYEIKNIINKAHFGI